MPVYIWAPEEEGQFQPGRCSRWWLRNSLEALEADLKALGSRIVYRSAPESRTALLQLVQETGATVSVHHVHPLELATTKRSCSGRVARRHGGIPSGVHFLNCMPKGYS